MKWKYCRPKFAGRAAFKTFLKRRGFKVKRDFYGGNCCIAKKSGRLWRFRFHAGMVDISCEIGGFDRWANSTEVTVNLEEFKSRGTA
jgi:hypothetical protein